MIHSKNKHSVSWASWETLSIAWSTKKTKVPVGIKWQQIVEQFNTIQKYFYEAQKSRL